MHQSPNIALCQYSTMSVHKIKWHHKYIIIKSPNFVICKENSLYLWFFGHTSLSRVNFVQDRYRFINSRDSMPQKIWINLEKKRLAALELKTIFERKQGFSLETFPILGQRTDNTLYFSIRTHFLRLSKLRLGKK